MKPVTEFSQGIANDGPCILKNGQPMTPEQIVKQLNLHEKFKSDLMKSLAVIYRPHIAGVIAVCEKRLGIEHIDDAAITD